MMVQDTVGVVEDVPLADGIITVVFAECCECPIGDVLLTVCAILIVGIEGEALRTIACCECTKVGNLV